MYTSTVESGPPLLMLHSHVTLVSKPPIPLLPIIYLLPLPLQHRPLLLAVVLHLLPSILSLTLSGFFNGALEVFEPGALSYFTFFCHILSTLSAFRNPILTHLSLSGFLDSLLCVLIVPTPSLAFSPPIPRTPAAALSFRQIGPKTFYLLSLCLIPTLIMQGSTSLLTTPPQCHFSMCMLPLFALLRRMAEPISFITPFFSPPEISSFWGTSITTTPSGTQKVLPTLTGRKYLTGSFLLNSSPSMILTHPPFSIAPLVVTPLLTSPLLPPLLLFLAPGRCIRTWVLTIYQFFYLSLSLRSIAPTSIPLPSIFRKLTGMTSPFTLTLTVPLQRNTRLFVFPRLLLSLPWGVAQLLGLHGLLICPHPSEGVG